MAHVAELDANNIVIRVIVVNNDYEPNVEAWASEWAGGGVWKQTSYNASIRKNYAGLGFTYDVRRDAFIPQKCHVKAILDENTCLWICTHQEHELNRGD